MPRSVARRLADSGEREAGRSFWQGQIDGLGAPGGRVDQPGRQGRRRSRKCWRAGHGGADATGGAGTAVFLFMRRRRMVHGRPAAGGMGAHLRAGIVAMTRPGVDLLLGRHGRHRRHAAMRHGRMRARQHACRSDALEGNRQQQQPHKHAAQADMDSRIHAAILAWHRRNTAVMMTAANLASRGGG
ncbi:hypothetical protein RCH14_003424 [Massilia sp. MP_M2]